MDEIFKIMKEHKKEKSQERRAFCIEWLEKNNIDFVETSPGCLKLKSAILQTIMFYPKSGTIIWKANKSDYQHRFQNINSVATFRKIKSII